MAFEAHCIVCGNAIYPAPPTGEPVCARAQCRHLVGLKDKMPAVGYDWFFAQRSAQIRETDRQIKEKYEKTRRALEREDQENQALREAVKAKIEGYGEQRFPLLAVPQNLRRLVNLPERRKRKFRDYINQLISKVTESPKTVYPVPLHPKPAHEASKLLGGACGLCVGACCLGGENHAYLGEVTLLRVMQTEPSLRPRHLLELYLSHLGKKTFENACVFQEEKGCVLPLYLRSNVCSNYYCPPLKRFMQAYDGDEKPEGAVVVVRARDHWSFPDCEDHGIAGAYLLTEAGAKRLDQAK